MQFKNALKIFGIVIGIVFLSILVLSRVEINQTDYHQTKTYDISENNTTSIEYNNMSTEMRNEVWNVKRVSSEGEAVDFMNYLIPSQREKARIVFTPEKTGFNGQRDSFCVFYPTYSGKKYTYTNSSTTSDSQTNIINFNLLGKILSKFF